MTFVPVSDTADARKKIAIVYPWPGFRNAETEFNLRAKKALANIGFEGVIASNNGVVLDQDHKPTGEVIDPKSLLFTIATHFSSPKLFDSFFYYAIWNPPELPLASRETYHKAAQNCIMYDDYLIYDQGRMRHHLMSVLMNSPRQLEGASSLVSSFPADMVMEPNLANPLLFYCGMNWEKVAYRSGHRHEGLLKLLDKTGCAKFFGPDKIKEWGGIRAWEGFTSHYGPIPFDGFSIAKEINKCGVALVISSDNHRRSAAATNRLYEACVAGAVIISDDNGFVRENFSDAALFIEFRKDDPENTFRQIMEKYNWIKANPDEARALALTAQNIFKEKFTLEKQLQAIIDNHPNRQVAVAKSLYSRKLQENVLAIYVADQPNFDDVLKQKLAAVIDNIENQAYPSLTLAIACDQGIRDEVENFCKGRRANIRVFPFPIWDNQKTRVLSDGIAYCAIRKEIDHTHLIFMAPNEIWFTDHITTLKRILEDNPDSVAAHSGRAVATGDAYAWDTRGGTQNQSFTQIKLQNLISCRGLMPGQVLFKSDVESYIDDCAFDFLDGLEYFAFLLFAELKHNKKPAFSKRISFAESRILPHKADPSLHPKSQVRFIQDLVHYEYDYLCSREIEELAPYLAYKTPLVDYPTRLLRQGARMAFIEFSPGCNFYNKTKEFLKKHLPQNGKMYAGFVKLNRFMFGPTHYNRQTTLMPELFDRVN